MGIKQPKDKGILLKDVLESEVDEKYFLSDKAIKYYRRSNTYNKCIDNENKSMCLTSGYWKRRRDSQLVKKNEPVQLNPSKESVGKQPYQHNRVYSIDAKSPTLDQDKRKNILVPEEHIKHPVALTEKRTEEAKKIRREHQQKYGKDFSPRRGKELAPRKDDKMNCLTATFSDKEHILLQPNLIIRRLTPVECERLQTVPDNYTNFVSNSQRYKMLGNGWTVDVIAYIFKHMKLNKDGIYR